MLKGSCLCGAVSFQFNKNSIVLFNLCHCKRCQKRSGGAHTAQLQVRGSSFQWTQGGDTISKYEPVPPAVVGTFCSRCGSRLPSAADWTQLVAVPVGLLDDEIDHVPEINIHSENAAGWARLDDSIKTINGQGTDAFWTKFMQQKRNANDSEI